MALRIIIFSLFTLMVVTVGFLGMRKARTFSDFFLGGGKIGPWMTAFTYGAAYFSAVLFIGFAGKIGWDFGLSGLWIALGNSFVGVLGVWWLMGHRIKRMAVETGAHTMPEYFAIRYNSRGFKLYSSLAIFVFFIPYSAAVFIGLSYLFKATFNIDYELALLFMGALTGVYLVLGGYQSMTMIDVLFGMIMVAGALVLFGITFGDAGGWSALRYNLAAADPRLAEWVGPPGWWPLCCLVFLTSVAPFAMPQLVQKFYAIRDRRAVRIGMIASTIFSVIISGTAYFTGAAARIFLSPEKTPAAFSAGKPVFDALIPELFTNVIPESLTILMLLLILSASMSTLAALVLLSSSSVVRDLYAGFINKNVEDKTMTRMMRIFNAVFVVLSVILAWFKPATIVAILGISWGAIGSTFLGPFLWGILLKRANRTGAILSSLCGLGTCLALYAAGTPSPEAGTVGMIVSLLVPLPFLLLREKTTPA